MPAKHSLQSLQRRFMAALIEPIFGESRARSDLPQRSGAVSSEFLATAHDLIAPSATLEPIERLELYHRQYWYRLLDSLAEDFPALRAFLGETLFWDLLERYLVANPPRQPNLRQLGAGLAEFIPTMSPPLEQAIHAEELARLEYIVCEIFEAGDCPPLQASDLPHASIALQPHVRLLTLKTPAHTFWRTHRKRSPLFVHRTPRFFLVIHRQQLRIQVDPISQPAYLLLSALATHRSLAAAIDQVAHLPLQLQPADPHTVQGWFKTWFEKNWFRRAPISSSTDHSSTLCKPHSSVT